MHSGSIKADPGSVSPFAPRPSYLGDTRCLRGLAKMALLLLEASVSSLRALSSPGLGPEATRAWTLSFRLRPSRSFTHPRLSASRPPAPPASRRRRRLRLQSGGPAAHSASRRCRFCCRPGRRARIWREPGQPPRPARRLEKTASRDSYASGKEEHSAPPRENFDFCA